MKDLSQIAKKLRERSEQQQALELFSEQFEQASPFAPYRISYAEFQTAAQLKKLLLEEFKGTMLEEIYDGRVEQNEYGHYFHLVDSRPLTLATFNAQSTSQAILSELKLLYGIGPIIEQKLRAQGVQTIADLTQHPRWGTEARTILQQCAERNVQALEALVLRWLPRSHPLSLSLTGLIEKHEMLFFDLESLGLFGRPIILLGFAQPTQDGLQIHQYLVRHIEEELPALIEALKQLQQSRALVTFNGRAFDLNYVEERLSYYSLNTNLNLLHFDLLHYARRLFRNTLPDCRLETLERQLIGLERAIDIPSALVPDFYNTYLEQENIGPLIPIIEHNKQDLVTLGLLLSKLCTDWEVCDEHGSFDRKAQESRLVQRPDRNG